MKESYEPGGPASTAGKSPVGALLRRTDPDRFLTTLFAPPAHRETLFVLFAFNAELARAWDVASQPMLALMRLQWWRDILAGADRRHEVATPLRAEIAAGRLDAGGLLGLIEARAAEADGFCDLAAWQSHLTETAGAVAAMAGRVLGAEALVQRRLQALGAAYGAAGVLRRAAAQHHQARAVPPAELAAWGVAQLGQPARLPRPVVAAGLVGVLARRDLARPGRPALRGIADRCAVTLAALRCTV